VSAGEELVAAVLSGESPELRVLAAQGILPLATEELIPLQVRLAASDDAYLADAARLSLLALDRRLASSYLAHDAPVEVLRWFAREHPDPLLTQAILGRRDAPGELLVELAPRLTADLQEALLLRQDAILERPEILAALEGNARLTPFARRRIAEYREHLVPREKMASAQAVSSADLFAPEAGLDESDLEEIERVRELPAGGESDQRTGLSEYQIRSLPLPIRLKLCRGASRTLRSVLIKDINPNVAIACLAGSAFTEDEIETVAASRGVVDDVFTAIARKREWTARYGVCLNLVKNPRVPIGIAIRFVPRLGVRDLRNLSRDKNIADAVRTAAQRLYRIKSN
jgi:hypothetical protein